MSFYADTTGMQIVTGGWDEKPESRERDALILQIAENVADKTLQKYLEALSNLYYPEVYPEMYYLPVAIDATHPAIIEYQLQIPGIARAKQLLLMEVDGTYPSRVEVLIDALGHQPFALASARATLGPFAFRIYGGSRIVLTNFDTAHPARVYLEWEMVP